MAERYLVIAEVSQKQAYIFGSNKLRDNITNSETIARITSGEYLSNFSDNLQIVSEGGGHTILEFSSREAAEAFNRKLTAHINDVYPGIEFYVKIMPYDKGSLPGDNLKELVRLLEIKKAVRMAAFRQGTYGIEEIDRNTMLPVLAPSQNLKDEFRERDKDSEGKMGSGVDYEKVRLRNHPIPKGFVPAYKFEDLCGDDEDANFIAVIHVDGNGFGKRASDFYASVNGLPWDAFRSHVKNFSDSIDDDFKDAYSRLTVEVAESIRKRDWKSKYFPMRRVISSGDDICFVTEGKIGIESAARYLQILSEKVNREDGESYPACAGVALVHKKFPFYKAYEISEELCKNAKSFGAALNPSDQGKQISSIDWHIEFGEMPDTLKEIRRDYKTRDGGQLELRPFIVSAPADILEKERIRHYEKFRKLMELIERKEDGYASGKLKQMRGVLKEGEKSARYYLKFYNIESLAMESYHEAFEKIDVSKVKTENGLSREIFVRTQDGRMRSVLFDAIELMGNYEIL